MPMSRFTLVLLCLVASASATATDIPVRLDVATTHPVSGRLIVFAQRVDPAGPRPDSIDIESFAPPADTAIAARDVDDLDHGESVRVDADDVAWRSEEHTSELQSLAYLVCRLLLEKKQ